MRSDYISPYKQNKSRIKSPVKRLQTQLDNPVMTFGKESYLPQRPSTEMELKPGRKRDSSSAFMRPKGSFMNPTASKALKEVNRPDPLSQ